jgi:hypothetical protein
MMNYLSHAANTFEHVTPAMLLTIIQIKTKK